MEIMIICNLHGNIINNIHTVQPPFCWGGVEPPTKNSKEGGGGVTFFKKWGEIFT